MCSIYFILFYFILFYFILFYFILFYFILLSFHCTKYIYYMYNEASLQQVHTQQGKLPKTIVSYID